MIIFYTAVALYLDFLSAEIRSLLLNSYTMTEETSSICKIFSDFQDYLNDDYELREVINEEDYGPFNALMLV